MQAQAQKYNHLFLGEVTIADPDEDPWIEGGTHHIAVWCADGTLSSAKCRALDPIYEVPIPESHRSLNILADEIHEIAQSKGWYTKGEERPIPELLMLVVSELAEALEELRAGHTPTEVYEKDGKPEGFAVEVADALIRLLDMCAYLEIDIDAVVREKIEFNKTRSFKHGKAF